MKMNEEVHFTGKEKGRRILSSTKIMILRTGKTGEVAWVGWFFFFDWGVGCLFFLFIFYTFIF